MADTDTSSGGKPNRAVVQLLATLRDVLGVAWRVVRAPIVFVLNILAALVIIFEEWGWKPLSQIFAWLAQFRPWAAVERAIASLPPYAALVVFVLPTTLLFPLKLVAMWLLAQGKVLAATGLFAGAKVVSTALIARLFLLTRPALMQIAWFAAAYNWFIPWKDHLFEIIRSSAVWRTGRLVKARLKHQAKMLLAQVRANLAPLRARITGWIGSG